jgi:branched-chain amino acid transport system substrate-binding protein
MEQSLPVGSSAFGFVDADSSQTAIGALYPVSGRAAEAVLDKSLEQSVRVYATAVGAGANLRSLGGLDNLSDARAGVTSTGESGALTVRWDIVVFRRGEVVAILFVGYPDGDKPAVSTADLAFVLDKRIGKYLASLSPSGPGSPDTIKVDILAPLSGAVPSFGISMRNGAQLAIDEWNARGGVLGKKIVAVVEDSQCSADPARNAANKVIDQDGVHYIIGEVCSSASIPVSEIAEARHVVQISPTSTNPNVTLNADGSTKRYVFRACFIDSFQGTVMAHFALSQGYKTAFVMADQGNDYVRGLAQFFIAAFQKGGGTIVGRANYNGRTATDFSAILAKVAAAKPDVLYLPDYYTVVNLVGRQAKQLGLTAVMMGGDGWDSSDLDVEAADGGFYTNHYDPSDTHAVVKDWIVTYGQKYQTDGQPAIPDAIATLGYDATNLMLTAIQEAGVDDPARVKDALAKLRFSGVTGTLTFDAQHNPLKPAVIMQITGGQKVFAGTVNP